MIAIDGTRWCTEARIITELDEGEACRHCGATDHSPVYRPGVDVDFGISPRRSRLRADIDAALVEAWDRIKPSDVGEMSELMFGSWRLLFTSVAAGIIAKECDDVVALLRDVVDGEQCTADPDGNCQTHMGEPDCSVARAQALLHDIDNPPVIAPLGDLNPPQPF